MTTLTIGPDGTITGLYTEAIPLASLGRMSMRRASHIEFNETSQIWEVLSPDKTRVLFSDFSRSTCLQWEHDNADTLLAIPPAQSSFP
ncbi:MAG: hypothetical protein LBK99_16570 [Opitutaceae bacterium]|jgi:hypothetical protein|nr:hypothetical protein [Opitutaceae bacterium]